MQFLHSTAGLSPCQEAVSHRLTRRVIGTPLITGCSGDAPKRGSGVKVGGELGLSLSAIFVPFVARLCPGAAGD